jgi:hypothetical protein
MGHGPDVPAGSLVCVYEAINDDLREIFVGATTDELPDLTLKHVFQKPKEIAHWRGEHRITYRAVEYAIPKAHADPFIEAYCHSRAMSSWKVLRG